MKKLILLLLGCTMTFVVAASPTELQWLTSVPEAQARAKRENKLVLLDFTGSDWCIACKALEKGVFSTSAFQNYADKNLVLVQLDYPIKDLPPALKAANDALQEKYKVNGFPTLIALKPDGKVVWTQEGYAGDPPSILIAELEKARK